MISIYIETLGCMKNFCDSDMALGILERNGFRKAGSPEEADVIIVNTCGFIGDAKKESIDRIFSFTPLREEGKKLIVTGCLTERYAEELYEELPEADGIIGVNDYEDLPDLIRLLTAGKTERFKQTSPCDPAALDRQMAFRKIGENPYSQYLRIAEGCNNCCTYCIIPSIRGSYRSRPMESLVQEAERLAEAGCRELILIAQDTTMYGMDLYGKKSLPELLRKLAAVSGIRWIRLMYCYEDKITDELIRVMKEEPKILPYIDIPIQHISDSVLRDMNRSSDGESIRATIKKLKEEIPDIHIRTTLIVGFPGETEEDFEELEDFVEEQRFARLGVFSYSREEGTPAADMEDQIPEDIKQERLDRIMSRQMEISLEENQRLIGRVLEVIVDEEDEDGSYIGRTIYDAPEIDNAVIFTPVKEHQPGDIVPVMILDAFDYDLEGKEVPDESAQ